MGQLTAVRKKADRDDERMDRGKFVQRGARTGAAWGAGITAGLAPFAIRPLRQIGMSRGEVAGALASGGINNAVTGALTGAGVNLLRTPPKRKKETASKADRDQNSSIGTSISWTGPKGDHRTGTTTAQTRTGAFAGKTRGVGRHQTRDQNSTPGHTVVRTPTLRDINGKFAGEGPGVKVFHPIKGSVRGAVHTKQLFRGVKKPELLSKADEPRKGMLGPVDLASMAPHTGARVGRRL